MKWAQVGQVWHGISTACEIKLLSADMNLTHAFVVICCFFSKPTFSKNSFRDNNNNNNNEIQSERQTVWIQIRTDVWDQTVGK